MLDNRILHSWVGIDFAVVIPLFNRQKTIQRALDSVIGQLYLPSEIIVVDDGSSDAGPSLVTAHYETVRLVRQQNAGPGAARNAGIRIAKSEWIAFLDSDDVWQLNHLLELSKAIGRYPRAGLVCTKYFSSAYPDQDRPGTDVSSNVELIDYFKADAPAFTSSTAARRAVIEGVGGFSHLYSGEDKELWARIALDYPVVMSTAYTSIYVDTEGSLSDLASRQVQAPPRRVSDLSPTLSTVYRAVHAQPEPLLASRESLRWFLNHRLTIDLKAALRRGDVAYARAICSFLVPPLGTKRRALTWLVFLPKPLVIHLLDAFRRGRVSVCGFMDSRYLDGS